MKRGFGLLLAGAVMVWGAHAALANPAKMKTAKSAEPKPQVIIGEIVDMGCYGGNGARGEKHKECATKCIANGMPMGLLTKEGKLYLLTLNHDNADPYNKAKTMASATVAVTGVTMETGGIRMIDVSDVQVAR
jgi:hypothetical protein